jgi:hypothetical protein
MNIFLFKKIKKIKKKLKKEIGASFLVSTTRKPLLREISWGGDFVNFRPKMGEILNFE